MAALFPVDGSFGGSPTVRFPTLDFHMLQMLNISSVHLKRACVSAWWCWQRVIQWWIEFSGGVYSDSGCRQLSSWQWLWGQEKLDLRLLIPMLMFYHKQGT